MDHKVKILSKEPLNHNVIQFHFERPIGYSFVAGQAIEMTLASQGPAPFTFTGLSSSPYLELTIKIYAERHGLTATLARMQPGDAVSITDPWDSYINKGPGIFIAGGAGITPFIALLRQFKAENNPGRSQLFFFNKTRQDIFMEKELTSLLGSNYVNVITGEPGGVRIDEAFIRKNISNLKQPLYVCGPPPFMEIVQKALVQCGAAGEMVIVSF